MTPIDPGGKQYLETLGQVLRALNNLQISVARLAEHVTISQTAAREAKDAAGRSRIVARVVAVMSILALITAGLTVWSLRLACESGNDARVASTEIWAVVLQADAKSRTPKQRQQAKVFAEYVAQVYRPHDCWNLLKSYPAPKQPDLS